MIVIPMPIPLWMGFFSRYPKHNCVIVEGKRKHYLCTGDVLSWRGVDICPIKSCTIQELFGV